MSDTIKKRGLASLSPDRRREIARFGGLAVKRENRAFAKNRDLAREAGRRGGLKRHGLKAGDLALLKLSADNPVTIHSGCDGRTQASVSRLMRRGFWELAAASEASGRDFDEYVIAEAGREFLASLEGNP